MKGTPHFDFWYAVNNTRVLKLPASRLETFGNSVVNYHLLTELMDNADKVRIREGRIDAYKPEILTPQSLSQTILEGFGPEAARYADWLRSHQQDLYLLKYGFAIKKQEINDHIVSETLPVVIGQMQERLTARGDPLGALLVGVEEPWEVCLLKLMVEVVQKSVEGNVTDLRRDPQGHRHEVEKAFYDAVQNSALIPQLSEMLRAYGLFEEYEDRFFSLVRSGR